MDKSLGQKGKIKFSVSLKIKREMISLHKNGSTTREISKKYSVSKSTVGRLIKNFNDSGEILKSKKMGKPRITTKRKIG